MNIPLFSIFIASLLGSLHCVSMCGGFVVYNTVNSKQKVLANVFYNSGRLITYLFLGMTAGFIGSSLDNSAIFIGMGKISSLLIGAILIASGLSFFLKQSEPELIEINKNLRTFSLFKRISNFTLGLYNQILNDNSLSEIQRALLIGMLSTLLPCGWLYSFVAFAGASASPIEGLFVMFYFWLGSLPYLLITALVSERAFSSLRAITPRLTAIILILLGLLGILIHW
jgi:uncharacterized protein